MLHSKRYLPTLSVSLLLLTSISIAGCATSSSNGAGYQFTHFADARLAIQVSQDPLAGPAIASNNAQCKKDEACVK